MCFCYISDYKMNLYTQVLNAPLQRRTYRHSPTQPKYKLFLNRSSRGFPGTVGCVMPRSMYNPFINHTPVLDKNWPGVRKVIGQMGEDYLRHP